MFHSICMQYFWPAQYLCLLSGLHLRFGVHQACPSQKPASPAHTRWAPGGHQARTSRKIRQPGPYTYQDKLEPLSASTVWGIL